MKALRDLMMVGFGQLCEKKCFAIQMFVMEEEGDTIDENKFNGFCGRRRYQIR